MQEIVISPNQAGQRLDKFVYRHLKKPPKTFVQKLLRKKSVTLNGKKAVGSHLLVVGDVLRFFVSEETVNKFAKPVHKLPAGAVDVIFEDEHVILLNKPAGLSTQPDKAGGDSLIGRLRGDFDFQPVAVNRLDKNTTGITICAKTLPAAQALSKLIHDRKIQKIYIGVAHGKISREMTLEGKHIKDPKQNISKITENNGKFAQTHINPLNYHQDRDVTLLEIHLHTGRSHQIRAHLQSINHPLVGDTKYGGKGIGRQMLHAHKLIFPGLTGVLETLSNKTFTATLPDDMKFIKDFHLCCGLKVLKDNVNFPHEEG